MITRHFITLDSRWGARQVHYRRAGTGPALLLLHQSPQSSREFEPLMRDWASDFTVIAPDTPGYGLSDPLAADPVSLDEFAIAIMEFADAIGLTRFGIYGYHTGGGMAVAIADGYPTRVVAAAANGLAMLTEEQRADILANYLPRLEPRWDGGHLTWLWARLREQSIFFPWHDRRLAARMDFTMHPPEALQRNLLEFMRSGDHYRVAYRAAFEYLADAALARMRPPVLITAAALDPLAVHLDRIGERSAAVEVTRSADPAAAIQRCHDFLMQAPGEPAPAPPAATRMQDGLWQDSCHTDEGSVRLLRSGDQPQVIVLHDAGGSALTAAPLVAALGQAAAIDLPGHGEGPEPAGQVDIDSCAAYCLQVMDALDLPAVTLAGEGTGAWIAVAVASRRPERLKGLILKDPPILDPALRQAMLTNGLPSLAPVWHGGHLGLAWHMTRDARLYFPWFRRDRESVRWLEPRLDEEELTVATRERLVSDGHWQDLLRSALHYPAVEQLGKIGLPVTICAEKSSPYRTSASSLAGELPAGCFVELGDFPTNWRLDLP